MSDTPKLRSREQIETDLKNGILARIKDLNDFNVGSVISQIVESISHSEFKASADIIAMIDSKNIDRATGEALLREARDNNVPVFPAESSTGSVSITDLSFTKRQTSVYPGQPAPVAGSLTIYVSNVDGWPATGSFYIGRGTPNVEGPLFYTAITPSGSGTYYQITLDPTSPTTKFHNIGESVILAQGGNRIIPANTVVQTSQGANVSAVDFNTTSEAVILDGEVTVSGVPVICQSPGNAGNVPRGSIRNVIGLPFPASVTNDKAFTNGRPADTEDQIRQRIKDYEKAKSKGTSKAIEVASIDVVAPDELKKVRSAKVISLANTASALVFDDGSGYEPLFTGSGYELIVDSAIGGEKELQLRRKPIAQALVKSVFSAPFAIVDGSFLRVNIKGVSTTHQFTDSDFKVPGAATAFEIASSINGNPNLNFLANTSEGGTKVILYPKDRLTNSLTVEKPSSGIDANEVLGFSDQIEYSLRLYKNDQPLIQDGEKAILYTKTQSSWSPSIVSGDTLIYSVDGTPPITVTVQNSNFQVYDNTATVSYLTDITLWKKVLNDLMPGVIVKVDGESLSFESARGADSRASLSITGGTLKNKIFQSGIVLQSFGKTSDYTFNKQTGQIGLSVALQPGDKLTAGSQFTRAKLTTNSIPSGPATPGRVWLIVDGQVIPVPNGLQSNTSIEFSKTGTKLTITGTSQLSTPEGFGAARPGDWILVWANPTDAAPLVSNQGFWRIETAEEGEIVVDDGVTVRTNLNTPFVPSTNRIVIVRSDAPIQLLSYPASSLSAFATAIQNQLEGVQTDIIGSKVRISTNNYGKDGELFVLAVDGAAEALGLVKGSVIKNVPSHFGYNSTLSSEASTPNFRHSVLGLAVSDSVFNENNYLDYGGTEDEFLEVLSQYDTVNIRTVPDSNVHRRSLVKMYNESLSRLELKVPKYMKTGKSVMQNGDRYFLRNSYKFDANDAINITVDNDSSTKNFLAPVYRRISVSTHSTPTNQDFSANDLESNLLLSSPSSFFDFDFSDFKVYRRAHGTLNNGVYNLKFKSNDFGPVGNRLAVGIVYPDNSTQTAISHTYDVGDLVKVLIKLPVTDVRVPFWDQTSAFSVSKTTVNGKDTVTYTWRSGTEPDFSVLGSDLSVGDIVSISGNSDFLPGNKGFSAKLVAFTSNTFTVERVTGKAVADDLLASDIVNQSGVITVTTTTPHNLTNGNRVGLWQTSSPDGTSYPFNQTGIVSVTSPTIFTLPAFTGIPGGSIASGVHVSGIITITTATPHNLFADNIVLISGAGGAYDGLYAVLDTPGPNQFRYVKNGSSPAIGSLGRFDYQSYGPSTVAAINTASKAGTLVTLNIPGHPFSAGDIVRIQSIIIDPWSNTTNYATGDIVRFSGQNYVAIAATTGNQPDISPTFWQPTSRDLSAYAIVNSTTTNTIDYYYDQSGSATGTGGTATLYIPSARVARSIGGTGSNFLQFFESTATSQEISDYVSVNLAGKLLIENLGAPTDVVNQSTEDQDASNNYLSGNITVLKTFIASRTIQLVSNTDIKPGSVITVSGLVGALAVYNQTYEIIEAKQDGPNYRLTCFSTVYAVATTSTTVSGTFVGSRKAVKLKDGVASVSESDLQSLPSNPQFELKKPFETAPAIGEELRLVAITNDHLHRFWNKLIVTGLSNVADIALSKFGSDLQISTVTFGGTGSVEAAGGTANSYTAALVGSASIIASKLGKMDLPYDLRSGIVSGQYLWAQNQISQNKILGLEATSVIQVFADGIQINGGPGTFQTVRPTTHNGTTQFRIEKHGDFFAFIAVAGTAPSLHTANVREGDWVRLKNTTEPAWAIATNYSIGARVNYNGLNYTSLVNSNIGNVPSSSPSQWRLEEWNQANQGIYQIVRVFGQNTFWVKADNIVEEQIILGNTNNIRFYSYDSVMPGDTLVISTNILGVQNSGRYRVVDESFGLGYSFPTPTRIWTETLPSPQSGTALGADYNLVNIEEGSPLKLLKKVITRLPSSDTQVSVVVDSPELIDRLASSAGAFVTATGKLNYSDNIRFGVDSYRYYLGLTKELNRIIYGDSADPERYPGVRASGTDVDIKPALIKRIRVGMAIRVRTGVPFSVVRDRVKAQVAGYVNRLGVGDQVSISSMISAAQAVPGVLSVAMVSPAFDSSNDLIEVGADEKAFILDSTTDVTVSVLGS